MNKRGLRLTVELIVFGIVFILFASLFVVFAYQPDSGGGYATQSLVKVDDYTKFTNQNYLKESSAYWIWKGSTPTVWQDSRTGLYWSENLTDVPGSEVGNNFNVSSCPFFNLSRGSYVGSDTNCGSAINLCAQLNNENGGQGFGDRTGWYLPSTDELIQAYVNGIYVNTTDSFTTTNSFWSATERADSTNFAWALALHNGQGDNYSKANGMNVRCVSRD